jgi:glycosyltransferase involved in cell wall biosynthesis
MSKILFIGHFSNEGANINHAASAAGDIVQKQIINESVVLLGGGNVISLSLEPKPCWPKGPLCVKSAVNGDVFFPSFINLPLIKNIIFSIHILYQSIKFRPSMVVQYNSYLFENLVILLIKFLLKIYSCCIIQDVRVGSTFTKRAIYQDKIANFFIKYFDMVIPVTESLAQHIKLKPDKYIVFQGGITSFGFECLKVDDFKEGYAVFAGALEPHNGILKLLDAWDNMDIKLHIFGKGALEGTVIAASLTTPNVIYHGFCTQDEVMKWQSLSRFNICLRYSEGINSEYFFPSKFFNISLCPGLVVLNDFVGIPGFLKSSEGLCLDNLSDLAKIQSVSDAQIRVSSKSRRKYIIENNTWSSILKKVFERAKFQVSTPLINK